MEDDHGWIRVLLDEAENERMHLMTFIHIVKCPSGDFMCRMNRLSGAPS